MAVKSVKKKTKPKIDPYPWYALLDLDTESETRTAAPPARPKGRPRSKFARKAINMTMTPDQIALLDRIRSALEEGFGAKVSRGSLVAFMTVRMLSALQNSADEEGNFRLPENTKSFSALAKYLDELGG
jgi:hypothetical protein